MAIQTVYNERQDAARAGHLANTELANLISRTVQTPDGVDFAVAVERGTGDNDCVLFAGGTPLGIVVRQRAMDANEPNKFKQYSEARIATKGAIWVNAPVAVAQGDPVFVLDADGTFSNVATGATAYPNAVWDTTTSGAGLAVIALDIR